VAYEGTIGGEPWRGFLWEWYDACSSDGTRPPDLDWRGAMPKAKRFIYKEDKHMRAFGDIDYQKKIIRVNPTKGDLVNTILHEEMHRKHPDMPHRTLNKKVQQKIAHMDVNAHLKVLKNFLKKTKGKKRK
jgi:hypothetical protein